MQSELQMTRSRTIENISTSTKCGEKIGNLCLEFDGCDRVECACGLSIPQERGCLL